jgi:hypothetical protein
LEVDDPEDGEDREIRKRRVQFYQRNGAKPLKDVRYILPPLQGSIPTQMIIMLISPNKQDTLKGGTVKELFKQIYEELYCRDENDPLLNSFVNSVPDKVEIALEGD